MGRDNGEKRGKSHQGTCIKDPWTKSKWGLGRGWEAGMAGLGVSGGGEMETTILEQQ